MVSLQEALEEVRSKFSSVSVKEFKDECKKVLGEKTRRHKFDELEKKIDEVLSGIADIPEATFVKLAKKAWNRKYPEGREAKSNEYSVYLKTELPRLKVLYPTEKSGELVRRAAKAWQEQKMPKQPVEEVIVDPLRQISKEHEIEPEIEPDANALPKQRKGRHTNVEEEPRRSVRRRNT
ncbi:hypothetical protein EBU71_17295 [bacterium]|nr:hypothetical protein [Candidatus Elulimicrobium humile]